MEIANGEGKGFREYMPSLHPVELQRRRENFAVSLRKEKRRGSFLKGRGTGEKGGFVMRPLVGCLKADENLSEMEKLLYFKRLLVENNGLAYEVLRFISEEFRVYKDTLAGALVNLGFVEVLGRYLKGQVAEEVTREATYIICNIASGPHEYTEVIVSNGMIDSLLKLVHKKSIKISDNAIWALSNILADCKDFWVCIVDKGVISLVSQFTSSLESFTQDLVATLSTFIKSISLYPELLCDEDYLTILNITCEILKISTPLNILISFSHLLQAPSMHKYFFELNMPNTLFICLSNKGEIMRYALLSTGYILMHSEQFTEILIKKNLLDLFEKILTCEDKIAIKYCLWCISNIAENDEENVQSLVNHEVFAIAVSMILDCSEKIRLEASYVMRNACINGKEKASIKLREIGTISAITQGFSYPEPEYLLNLLRTIGEMMANLNYSDLFEETGCTNALSMIEYHINDRVRSTSEYLLNTFYQNAHLFKQCPYY